MDSSGWFDSGYVVPGTDVEIGGKKIFTNYNNTRMYIEGQTSAIEEDYREHWYYTGKSINFTYAEYRLRYNYDRTERVWYTTYRRPSISIFTNYNETQSKVGKIVTNNTWSNIRVSLLEYVYFNETSSTTKIPRDDRNEYIYANEYWDKFSTGALYKGFGATWSEYFLY